MGQRVIKYLRHAAFPAALWTARNPYLYPGEVGYELNESNIVKKLKVGPGKWNDLPYITNDIFPINANVTNPIGDATGNLFGKTTNELLQLMLNPYKDSIISNVLNNAGGGYGNNKVLEIGQTLTGNVNITYSVSNPNNLSGSTPIFVSTVGSPIFSNQGYLANSGTLTLNLISPLSPVVPLQYTVNVSALDTKGLTPNSPTYINFSPRIIWGNTASANPTSTDINNMTQKQFLVTNIFKKDYTFNATGYCVVAIPTMLNPGTMTFTDVTDPNAPAGFSMENLGTLTINNGVGNYSYTILRSTYYITASTSKLRIA